MKGKTIVVVDKKGAKLKALEIKYNYELGVLRSKITQYLRKMEIKKDCEESFEELDGIIEASSEMLDYLEEMDEKNTIAWATAKINYETYDGSIKDIVTEDKRYERLEEKLHDFIDSKLALAEVVRDKNKAINQKEFNKNLLNQINIDLELLQEEAKTAFQNFKKTTLIVERVVGYSIGSHTLDWCYNDYGDLVLLPQIGEIEIKEREAINNSTPLIKHKREESKVEVESEVE